MKTRLFYFFICMFVSTVILSEENRSQNSTKTGAVEGIPNQTKFNINNISSFIFNDGASDYDGSGDAGFTFPRGSGKTAVYASGFVWGGKVNGQIRVGGTTYPTGLKPGRIISTNIAEDPTLEHVRIYRVRRNYETANLGDDAFDMNMSVTEVYDQYDKDWNEWPAIYGAPFEDINGNGSYEPSIDIPGIPGSDQTIWFVANDIDDAQAALLYGSPSIGIELQVTIWGYEREDSFGDLMFRKYKLINKSTSSIQDMYVSMWSDPDVGSAGDDYVGCDSNLSLAYAYNASNKDDMYGNYPPAVGFTFMQGPIVQGDPSDVGIFDGREFPGMRNLPMSTFYFFINSDEIYADPELGDYNEGTLEFHNLLLGKIGTTGEDYIDPITLLPTKFPLAGEPLTGEGWIDGIIRGGGDRRMGMVSGPFSMAASDTQEVIVVEMAELTEYQNMAHISNIYGIKRKSQNIKKVLQNNLAVDLSANPIVPIGEETEIISSALLINKNSVIQSYTWTLENKPIGSNTVLNEIDFSNASFNPDVGGYYLVSLLAVTDIGDSAIGKIKILASSNNAPIVDFTLSETELTMGEWAIADASSSSDNEGDSLSFEWDGNFWYENNENSVTNFQPKTIGKDEIEIFVSDGMFTTYASTKVSVHPKFEAITKTWNFIDTNYQFADDRIFSIGDTAIGVSHEAGIDSSKIVIYNKTDTGMEFTKEISVPRCQSIESIKNDLLFVNEISNNSTGNNDPSKISIYQIDNDWYLTKLLSNYSPSYNLSDDILNIYFNSDTAYAVTEKKIYKIDFLTNPTIPVVLDSIDLSEIYNSNIQTTYPVFFRDNEIFIYYFSPSIKYYIDVRRCYDFSLIKKVDISFETERVTYWDAYKNNLLCTQSETIKLLEISDSYELISRSSVVYDLTVPWFTSSFINLRGSKTHFIDEQLLVVGGPHGIMLFDVSDLENPIFAGSCLDGGVYSRLRKFGDNYSFDWIVEDIGYYSSGVTLDNITSIENQSYPNTIREYKLEQNYPNPFNPITTINFSLKENGFVNLEVFNLLGQRVAQLINKDFESGSHTIQFNGNNLSSGIYFYKIQVGSFTNTKKLLLLK